MGQASKRQVFIRRDGKDFIVKNSDLGIIFRHHDLDAVRKACIWLQWEIINVFDPMDPQSIPHVVDEMPLLATGEERRITRKG